MARAFLAFLFLFLTFSSFSTEYKFLKYSVEDGLNHEIVRGVLQDERGFIWVATEGGLHKFDGFQFDLVKLSNTSAETAISDFDIDDYGNIWISTFGNGLTKLSPTTGEFSTYTAPELSSNNLSTTFVDSQNNIWIASIEDGVDLFNSKSGVIEDVSSKVIGIDDTKLKAATTFTEDSIGRIWIGTDENGIFIFNPANNSWESFSISSSTNAIPSNRIKSLYSNRKGDIWIGTADKGLIYFNSSTRSFTNYEHDEKNTFSLVNNRVLSITQDNKGKLLVGTDGGLSIFEDGRFYNTKQDSSIPEGLSDNKIISIFQDRTGLVWIGTYRGLNLWNPKTELFNHTLPRINGKSEYNLAMDFSQKNNGEIVIATYGGGIVFQTTDFNYKVINKASGLIDDRVMSIFVDRDDGIWGGTRAHGLIYQPSPNEEWISYTHNPNDPDTLPSNGITDILQDSNGNIWVSTYSGGVSKKVGESFKNFTSNDEAAKALSSQNIFQIIEDRDGNIWLASDNGINVIERDEETVTQFLSSPDSDNGLTAEICWNIFEDSKGNFWIATQGNGIEFWKYEDRAQRIAVFKNLTINEGMPSNTVYSFEEDDDGNIWFSSSKGIGKISLQDWQIESFDKSHGLQGYDYVLGSGFKDSNGKIFFGGTNGFNQFYPNEIKGNTIEPNVELQGITSITESIEFSKLTNEIVFDHNDYLVSFDYVALDFAAPEKNQYQYRLVGFDTDWIDVGNRRRATYTNLPAGSYEFQVKAANNDGVWSEPQINLPVVVKPAPWKTPFAYAIYALVFGSIIFIFLRNHMQRLAFDERQRKKLEQQVAQRTEELASQNEKLQKLNDELDLAYRTDALTGIRNRRFLESYLQDVLPSLTPFDKENPQYMLVVLLDIDNLKPINDAYGHAAGDATISHAASLLSAIIPPDSHLIRWGGDEFLLLRNVVVKEESKDLVNKLIANINAEHFSYLDKSISLSCSAGFAHFPFDESAPKALSWDQVTMLADKAMNCAKADEQNNWIGVTRAKREVNDLYVSDLMHCDRITDATELVELVKG